MRRTLLSLVSIVASLLLSTSVFAQTTTYYFGSGTETDKGPPEKFDAAVVLTQNKDRIVLYSVRGDPNQSKVASYQVSELVLQPNGSWKMRSNNVEGPATVKLDGGKFGQASFTRDTPSGVKQQGTISATPTAIRMETTFLTAKGVKMFTNVVDAKQIPKEKYVEITKGVKMELIRPDERKKEMIAEAAAIAAAAKKKAAAKAPAKVPAKAPVKAPAKAPVPVPAKPTPAKK